MAESPQFRHKAWPDSPKAAAVPAYEFYRVSEPTRTEQLEALAKLRETIAASRDRARQVDAARQSNLVAVLGASTVMIAESAPVTVELDFAGMATTPTEPELPERAGELILAGIGMEQ